MSTQGKGRTEVAPLASIVTIVTKTASAVATEKSFEPSRRGVRTSRRLQRSSNVPRFYRLLRRRATR